MSGPDPFSPAGRFEERRRDAEPQIERSFFVIGTGWEIAPDLKHHGSTIDRAGFVWHIYERHP